MKSAVPTVAAAVLVAVVNSPPRSILPWLYDYPLDEY
jgi:hypothetical protein